MDPTKSRGIGRLENAGGIKNAKMKIKLRMKITGRVKALIASMLSPVLTDFAHRNVTSTDNSLQ